jgi:hypothetical protein
MFYQKAGYFGKIHRRKFRIINALWKNIGEVDCKFGLSGCIPAYHFSGIVINFNRIFFIGFDIDLAKK